MIFITVKFKVRPEYTDGWLDLVDDFTTKTRSEPGNLWFEWSRSVADPSEFVLLKEEGKALGFTHVESGPLVRSSYHAEQQVAPENVIPQL